MADWHNPLRPAQSALQAAQSAPVLAHLSELIAQSAQQLKTVTPLIPKNLLHNIKAGSLDESTWCLLVSNTATAAKLKHLKPDLEEHLRKIYGKSLQIRIAVVKAH